MKILYSALAAAILCVNVIGANGFAEKESDQIAIGHCLENWGHHPFGKENPKFRVITGKVKILGIGGNISDDKETANPELVLVKPTVSVMSKTEVHLLNPNGWYCLKGQVGVLGKTVVELHCKAKLAASNDGTTVLGASDADKGVTVLGSSRLERVGCDAK